MGPYGSISVPWMDLMDPRVRWAGGQALPWQKCTVYTCADIQNASADIQNTSPDAQKTNPDTQMDLYGFAQFVLICIDFYVYCIIRKLRRDTLFGAKGTTKG